MKNPPWAPALVTMAAATLLLMVACARAAPAAPGPAAMLATTPTALPAQTREMVVAFVREYRSIDQEWDQLNADLDQWRAGLTACDRAVGESALDGFVARANQITQGTLKLPRQPVLRELADRAIQAAGKQEVALRRLRDGWQPANAAANEAAEAERAAASRVWLVARDGLDDLRLQANPGAQLTVRDFVGALQPVNSSWDRVHQNFDSYRVLKDPEAIERLNLVLVGMSEVISGVRSLPSAPATSQWIWALSEVATGEDQTLRKLRAPQASDADKAAALAAVDAQILVSNTVRVRVQRQATDALNTPDDNVRAVAEFAKQFGTLAQDWDQLHQDFDSWRHGPGGCDAGKALQALDQLMVRSAALASRTQNLPSSSPLRSLQEPLSEAAGRQSEAVRVLRAEWRPYATDLYRALDQERRTATGLRRQVAAGVQDLQARLGISAQSP